MIDYELSAYQIELYNKIKDLYKILKEKDLLDKNKNINELYEYLIKNKDIYKYLEKQVKELDSLQSLFGESGDGFLEDYYDFVMTDINEIKKYFKI